MKIPKLSEAILLGSTLVQSGWCSTDGETATVGCALDMAVVAVGGKNWFEAQDYWPWLGKRFDARAMKYQVTSMFDVDVLMLKTKTLEQFCDWVRSIEPAEAPSCAEPATPCTDAVSAGVK